MQAPLKVGIWNRQPFAGTVYVYTCGAPDRPANWDPYDHISVPVEMETGRIAGHMHVTTRGSNDAIASFFPAQLIDGKRVGGMVNGEQFVYKYDFDMDASGATLLLRPHKNLDRCVSLYNGPGNMATNLAGTKVNDFMFVKGSDEKGNWRTTFVKKNVQAIANSFVTRFLEQQSFWVSVSGIDKDDSVELEYEVRTLGGKDVTAGKLSSSGMTRIERDWSVSEFRLTHHEPEWSPPVPGENCMSRSGRYRYGFSLKKPVVVTV
ncbi:MAG TPA: hypothetical protein VK176_10765 [Phycisphaerales bacterium]|nr:hypothetical protein [Phycisphaerales bacterium]